MWQVSGGHKKIWATIKKIPTTKQSVSELSRGRKETEFIIFCVDGDLKTKPFSIERFSMT